MDHESKKNSADHHQLPIPSYEQTCVDINSVITGVGDGEKPPSQSSSSSSEVLIVMKILTGFHAGYFRITLSLSTQALLWKTLTSSSYSSSISSLFPAHQQLSHLSHLLLWFISFVALTTLSFLYLLRCLFRFQSVKSEFTDHVGVNYLFAPWISCLILLQSSPANFLNPDSTSYRVLWWMFTAPIVALEVKIYGQWLTKGKRFLSMVANPTNQISIIANMACARAAAEMGCKEMALCVFSFGITHYLVLFVTLYQRFADRIPSPLRPVFFLFFATPSFACLAWSSISGSFDVGSKMLFFLSLFLFASLVTRPALFKKSMKKPNVAWWAFSSPLTALALASMGYAQELKTRVANVMMLVLMAISVIVTLVLMVRTVRNSSSILPFDDPFMVQVKSEMPLISGTSGSDTSFSCGSSCDRSTSSTQEDQSNV